jgi:hypothetical protein
MPNSRCTLNGECNSEGECGDCDFLYREELDTITVKEGEEKCKV